MKKIFLTENGLKIIKNELEELKKKNIEIINEISKAKKFGDLSENSEYQSAKNLNSINQKRIIELEEIIKNHEIINNSKLNKNIVNFSAIIELKNLENNKIIKYKIVDNEEINKIENGLSYESPLAKELTGKTINDIVIIKKFNKINKFKIISINYD